mgnify:CR=1 FL=1
MVPSGESVVEAPPLARSIYAAAEAGQFIPADAFGAVAEILYYAIPDDTINASRLYRANPLDGSANFVQNQPWGRVGVVGGPNNSGVLIGNSALITTATAATGQTDFQIPGSPVIVNFQTIEVGAGAGRGRKL